MKLENSHFRSVMRFIVFVVTCFIGTYGASAQNIDSLADRSLAASVLLDSVVIMAVDSGLNVADFVDAVLADESLYTAFRNLRRVSVQFTTDMGFEDKRGKKAGGLTGLYQQEFEGGCREITMKQEDFTGDYFKGRKNKERYYTARMYQSVFVTDGRVCYGNEEGKEAGSDDKMESRIDELKQLIFNPGKKARVPLIAGKTELFDPKLMQYYDFEIAEDSVGTKAAYRFRATAKEEVSDGKTIFKDLTTWFAKTDFQVLARDYTLVANTAAYSFDVSMSVSLIIVDEKYYPEVVTYRGTWNIPFKKRETGYFTINFSNFVTP